MRPSSRTRTRSIVPNSTSSSAPPMVYSGSSWMVSIPNSGLPSLLICRASAPIRSGAVNRITVAVTTVQKVMALMINYSSGQKKVSVQVPYSWRPWGGKKMRATLFPNTSHLSLPNIPSGPQSAHLGHSGFNRGSALKVRIPVPLGEPGFSNTNFLR